MNDLFILSHVTKHRATIDAWLADQLPALGELARTWFERLRGCGSDVGEVMHDGCPTACVGDAAFAYVGVYSAHVNVGFFHGATLSDPSGLLQGTGKRMRHVKLRPGADLDVDALDALVSSAYVDIRRRLTTRPRLAPSAPEPRKSTRRPGRR